MGCPRDGPGGGTPTARYLPFAAWDPDIEAAELTAFAEFWAWFTAERAQAAAAGAWFRAYCYSRSAEEGQMKRIAGRLGRGVRDEVDVFLASDEWVDLLEVVRAHLVTGRSMGLKETAPLAGFAWRADDSGGTLAMVKYVEAVDEETGPAARAGAQQWSSTTTRTTCGRPPLRDWLDGPARDLPSIDGGAGGLSSPDTGVSRSARPGGRRSGSRGA